MESVKSVKLDPRYNLTKLHLEIFLGTIVILKIALCGLRWFKLNVSKCQKDVKLSKNVKLSKRCQMSKIQTPRLWRRFTKN